MPEAGIFLQDACLQHRYIRSKDKSDVFERPERLRAVNIGISSAVARLECVENEKSRKHEEAGGGIGELADVLGKMRIESELGGINTHIVEIVQSQASVDILNHEAVKFVHGDIEGDIYLEKLKKWAEKSWDEIAQGRSEIPKGLPQGDLYLCPESIDAVQGALGTVCESVDRIMDEKDPMKLAFVAVRPPGHHCGEDTPSGFCFVNNVAVAAAHAFLKHKVNRVVIFDIDLHHGNGTQSIAWSINEETYRHTLESEAGAPDQTVSGLKIYYGSIHDVLSFPCEDGDTALVQAASVSIHRSHGQYIENIHLQTYESESHFWDVLYKDQYHRLIRRAEEFIEGTGGPGGDVLVFISCGMDACEHEYPSMSRHNRKVPTSFYYRFTKDARAFSEKYASRRLISVLEGGYSDRALTSATMAHICGLVGSDEVDEGWWSVEHLIEIEKATKKRRGGRPSLNTDAVPISPWMERMVVIFNSIDQSTNHKASSSVPPPPSTRTLRNRTKPNQAGDEEGNIKVEKQTPHKSVIDEAMQKPRSPGRAASAPKRLQGSLELVAGHHEATSASLMEPNGNERKPLPKVILRLGKKPEEDVL